MAHAIPKVRTLTNRLLPLGCKWRSDGQLRRAHNLLRETVREAERGEPDYDAAAINRQVVRKTSFGGSVLLAPSYPATT